MMIAAVKSGIEPGKPMFITEKALIARYLVKNKFDGREYCTKEELQLWSETGIHGTKFHTDGYVFIKVKDEGDDPFQYYTPPEKKTYRGRYTELPKPSDCCGSSGCDGGSSGGRNDGGNNSGGCGGCGGSCP